MKSREGLYIKREVNIVGKVLNFKGVEGRDVYNPTAPFKINRMRYLAARVEERDVLWQDPGYKPRIVFFAENDNSWFPVKNVPTLPKFEDPFKTFVSGELIFGGVRVYGKPGKRKFRTVFFKGKCLRSLREFACGPEMMKDIRLVELVDGRIGIFTRPQGGSYKRGRIGFTIVRSLEDVNEKNIADAEVIRENLKENEWEGVNDAKLLESGKIGVLAHQAKIKESGERQYDATTFTLDPYKMKLEAKDFKVIMTHDDVPEAPAKTPRHRKIVFSGEINFDYYLYTGIYDASVYEEKIENPYGESFLKRTF